MAAPEPASRNRVRFDTYLFFLALFAAIVLLIHAPLLSLPFFWDELGQFVPAALDLYHSGYWIPHSTVPNVHPPGVMAYLAGFWTVAGFSPLTTRIAMLLLASLGLLAAFLLAIRLCQRVSGAPAFLAAGLLLVTPIFYSQAMMAQLDMPAMLLTAAALLLFLEDRPAAAAAASTVLVLVKETGLVTPLVLGGWLLARKRYREAAYFAVPALALAGWLLLLADRTGHIFGNSEFTRYNVFYPLHPVRIAASLARRLYFLFFEDLRWIGSLAIIAAWRKSSFLRDPAWMISGLLTAAHVVLFSILGGATLERYLLPVLPVVYAAMAGAITTLRPSLQLTAQAALIAGLAAGNFWNPPYPFPFENNLAFTDFVALQQRAAGFVSRAFPGERITTAWPLSEALRRPELGYVSRTMQVQRLPDFTRASLQSLDGNRVGVLVVYSRVWDPPGNLIDLALVRRFWTRYYGYQPEASPAEVRLGVQRVARWARRGQWADVYVSPRLLSRASIHR